MIDGIMNIPVDSALGKMLAEVIEEKNGNGNEQPAISYDVEARVLIDAFQDIKRPNPFQPGSLVMVNAYGAEKYNFDPKAPILVVSTYPADGASPARDFSRAIERPDMDVMVRRNGAWIRFAAESWHFEFYNGPIAAPAGDADGA